MIWRYPVFWGCRDYRTGCTLGRNIWVIGRFQTHNGSKSLPRLCSFFLKVLDDILQQNEGVNHETGRHEAQETGIQSKKAAKGVLTG